MSNKFAPDFGRISLWIVEDSNNGLVSQGKVQILDENGDVEREVNVYLYENAEPMSERSPDYYGWLKVPSKKPSDGKKGGFRKPQRKVVKQYDEENDDGEDVAF